MTDLAIGLRQLKQEAKKLGMQQSFIDDVQGLIDKLPLLYAAREKQNGNRSR